MLKGKALHSAILVLSLFTPLLAIAQAPLTFEERVRAQEAIERVYYAQRIWPKENPGPKPPFEEMVPRATLEAKVTDYLKKSAALDQVWQRPLTAPQLQAEMDRMARETRDPATLKLLFAALGDDPRLVAECLARPLIAERLCHTWYASDPRFHLEVRRRAEAALRGGASACPAVTITAVRGEEESNEPGDDGGLGKPLRLPPREFSDLLARLPASGAPAEIQESLDEFALVRTVSRGADRVEFERLGFAKRPLETWLSTQEMPGLPQVSSHTWRLPLLGTLASSCSDGWVRAESSYVLEPREGHSAVWTGTEMIVWGGGYRTPPLNTGLRYSPATDTWVEIPASANSPVGTFDGRAVWTGTEVIVWGGHDGEAPVNAAGRYNPTTGSWIASTISTSILRPAPRSQHTVVWTGTLMIVWGGETLSGPANSGGCYSPATDTWTQTSTGTGCPTFRRGHTAVWTGNVMVVWGGIQYSTLWATGGRYNPTTNSWQATASAGAPSARYLHTAVWTGNHVVIWGGTAGSGTANTGARYSPASNTWTATSVAGECPSARAEHRAVWTGSRMIVWGGSDSIDSGALYDAGSDSWSALGTAGALPEGRSRFTALWTGTEMIVWGGRTGTGAYPLNSGGRYSPSSGTWVATSTGVLAPSARYRHAVVWTGAEMVVWAGWNKNRIALQSGGRFTPATGNWLPTSEGAGVPAARSHTLGVWTGREIVFWGGALNTGVSTNSGGRYDPVSDSWTPTSTGQGCPGVRTEHGLVWTGREVIVWGPNSYLPTGDGARYDLTTDSWTPISNAGAPSSRGAFAFGWTGTELFIWGGRDSSGWVNTGGLYDPATDTWRPTSTETGWPPEDTWDGFAMAWTGSEFVLWGGRFGFRGDSLHGARYNPSTDTWGPVSEAADCPTGRWGHSMVWTGSEAVVWGGENGMGEMASGGRYAPATDTWRPTVIDAFTPLPRIEHTAVWTGTAMMTWGGSSYDRQVGYYTLPAAISGPARVCPGATALLTASGSYASYQWSRDGVAISGATGASYSASVAGVYSVEVTDAGGGACHSPAHRLSVEGPLPSISGPSTGCEMPGVQLSTELFQTYQWSKDGAPLSGATARTLLVQASGVYSVHVVDFYGCEATTVPFSVSLSPRLHPTITGASLGCRNPGVTLSAGAYHAYQWYRDGVVMAGQTGGTLLVRQDGLYTVLVTDAAGCQGLSVGFTVTVQGPLPTVTGAQPACDAGALSTQTYASYQWFRNGLPIAGAVSNTYAATTPGLYQVQVGDATGCTDISPNFEVYPRPAPEIFIWGDDRGCDSLWLYTPGPYSAYQWFMDGEPVPGAQSANWTVSQSGVYAVETLSAQGCWGRSNDFPVHIYTTVPPLVSGPNVNACPDPYLTLEATAGYISYQWYNASWQPQYQGNSRTFRPKGTGQYFVMATDKNGCTPVSSPAHAVQLTYCPQSEAAPAGARQPLTVYRYAGDPRLYFDFQGVPGATGYHLYVGNIGQYYSHGASPKTVCNWDASVVWGEDGCMGVIPWPEGDLYFLVTAHDATTEGPSGYASSGVEIPKAQSTCLP